MFSGTRTLGLLTAFVLISAVAGLAASAATTITDKEIETTGILRIGPSADGDRFVLSMGNFAHMPGHFEEVSCLRDNSSNGTAMDIKGARDVYVLGKYAYVIGKDDLSLAVIDVSNPGNMTEISAITDDSVGGDATSLNSPVALSVSGSYAYVVSDTEDSLSVFDISVPSDIKQVGVLIDNTSGGTATHLDNPRAIYVSGGYAFIGSSGDNSLTIVDVSDPSNPHEVSAVVTNASYHLGVLQALYVSGGYAYTVSKSQYILSVIDVRDPAKPVWLGELTSSQCPGLVDVNTGGIYVSGRYAYVASNTGDSLTIIDVSDPKSMKNVSSIVGASSGGTATLLDKAKKTFIAGKYAYVTSINDGGFSVFDVSDPYNITELGYLQDDSFGGSASCLDMSQEIFVSGKYAFVTSKADNSLSAIDIAGIDTPSINTGSIKSNTLSITELAQISGDLFVKSAISVGGFSWFGSGVSILGSLRVFENVTAYGSVLSTGGFVNGPNHGISGNFTNGNCWTAYSGGIMYATNCTSA